MPKMTIYNYFSTKDAINAEIDSSNAFIISNERIAKDSHIGRFYTVLPNFKSFLRNREKFPHCHELLVDHKRKNADPCGRLVFDFDIKIKKENNEDDLIEKMRSRSNVINKVASDFRGAIIPDDFKEQIQDTILSVIETFYRKVDSTIIQYVWSYSKNPNKFSRHLTVKNIYFENWIEMSRDFYKFFCKIWDENRLWIKSNYLIDFQIIRQGGSLRMVGSSKIGGYPLVLDDNKFTLEDSLIRIYLKSTREQEQLFTEKNLTSSAKKFINKKTIVIQDKIIQNKIVNIDPIYPIEIYTKAFELYNKLDPGVFSMGKINGRSLLLIRKKANCCFLSGKLHESENAYLIINILKDTYNVKFGCFRLCYKFKCVSIGTINKNNLSLCSKVKKFNSKRNTRYN